MKEKYIVYYLSKTRKKMLSFIEKRLAEVNHTDLLPTHGNVLTVLYEHEGQLQMKDIGEIIGKDKSTISPLVNQLEKRGYVEKIRSEEDKRAIFVKLTDKGWAFEQDYNQISKDVNQKAYHGFSKKEKDQLLYLLKKLNENFNEDR